VGLDAPRASVVVVTLAYRLCAVINGRVCSIQTGRTEADGYAGDVTGFVNVLWLVQGWINSQQEYGCGREES
jgi:hypothetical protein